MSSDEPSIRTDLLTADELQDKFGADNYIAIAVVLAISIGIGCFYWYRGKNTTEDFCMASRKMTLLPATLSMVATSFSSVAMLGIPVLSYLFGIQFVIITVNFIPAALIAGKFYMPVFYGLKISTSLEYLPLRFGRFVHSLATAVHILHTPMDIAIGVYTLSLVLSQITGVGVIETCATILGICVIYTSTGGLRGVMWTETFQCLVMLVAFLVVTIKGVQDVGGATIVFDRNYQSGRLQLFDFEPDPRVQKTFWSVLIGGGFYHTSFICTGTSLVQRYNSCATLDIAKSAAKWTAPWAMAYIIFPLITGLVAYAFYYDCDPLKTKQISSADQIIPHLVLTVMGDLPLLPGVFVAGLLAATLSSISTGMNTTATIVYVDGIKALNKDNRIFVSTNARDIILIKLLSVIVGLAAFGCVFMAQNLPGILDAALTVNSILSGPLFGVYTLGIFIPFASNRGCIVGFITAVIFMGWMGFGQFISQNSGTFGSTLPSSKSVVTFQDRPIASCPASWTTDSYQTTSTSAPDGPIDDGSAESIFAQFFPHFALYDVSYLWFTLIGFTIVLSIGTLVSFCFPHDIRRLDSRLITEAVPGVVKSIFPKFTGIGEKVEKYWNEIGSLRNEEAELEEDTKEAESGDDKRELKPDLKIVKAVEI